MNEKLLQYIWQFRYFNTQQLFTAQGESLEIIAPGDWNTNQGPDFGNARIRIGNTLWAGPVELHLRTSDWERHGHQDDSRFDKVILHVVWQNDQPIESDGVPLLELQPRISNLMLDQYFQWMSTPAAIPCKGNSNSNNVKQLTWLSWQDRLLTERLQQKMAMIGQHLEATNQHWEEVFWRMLCRYFGGSINGESFLQVASSLPISILAKHKNQIHQLEALLLGQAGLLHPHFEEKYPQMLYKEYQFLQQKYGLRVINKPPSFLRMRPVNFPTIRLAQLAMLIQQSTALFSQIRETETAAQLYNLFDITANDYWQYHFKPDDEASPQPKHLGRQMVDVLIINAIAPVLFAYGKSNGQPALCDKAMQWLQQVPFEHNTYTQCFTGTGAPMQHAHHSQALIQLKKEYCDARRCLECAVGNAALRTSYS